MLQSLHHHIKGWIAAAIIAVISITFVLWGIQYYISSNGPKDQVLASVSGHRITVGEFARVFSQVLHQKPNSSHLNAQALNLLKQQLFTQMIARLALVSALRSQGFSVHPQTLRSEIIRNPQFSDQGIFKSQRFQQLLFTHGMSEQQYYDQLSQQLLLQQLVRAIALSTFTLPYETQRYFQLLNQTRTFGYFIVHSRSFQSRIKPTLDKLQQLYRRHQSAWITPLKVSFSYVLLSPEKISRTLAIPDDKIKDFYVAHQGNYRVPKRWKVVEMSQAQLMKNNQLSPDAALKKLKMLAQGLKKGHPLSSIVSQKPYWINADKVSLAMLSQLDQLKPGQQTLFRTSDGNYHLIYVVALKKAKQQSLSTVKLAIEKAISRQKMQDILARKAQRLSDLAYTHPSSLEQIARDLGLAVQTSPFLTRQGQHQGLFSEPKVLQAAFSHDVLIEGNNSDLIETKDGGALVLRVSKQIPSRLLAFNQVKPQLEKLAKQQLAHEKARALALSLKKALMEGESPQQLAKHYHLIWHRKTRVNRLNPFLSRALLERVFDLPYFKSPNTHFFHIITLPHGDYVVVSLFSIDLPKASAMSSKKRTQLNHQIKQINARLVWQLLTKSLMRNKIKLSSSVLKHMAL